VTLNPCGYLATFPLFIFSCQERGDNAHCTSYIHIEEAKENKEHRRQPKNLRVILKSYFQLDSAAFHCSFAPRSLSQTYVVVLGEGGGRGPVEQYLDNCISHESCVEITECLFTRRHGGGISELAHNCRII
jgi:hypothetical protein